MHDFSEEDIVVIDLQDPLTRRVLEVAERTGDFIAWWGFRGIHGRVWTLLALIGRPLSQSDAALLLGVSRSLVHGAVQELESFGLLQRVGDDRRAPVVAVTEVWPVITHILRTREWMLIEGVRVALDAAIQEADHRYESTGEEPFSRAQMRELMRLTDFAQGVLRLILSPQFAESGRGVRSVIRTASQFADGLRRAWRLSDDDD